MLVSTHRSFRQVFREYKFIIFSNKPLLINELESIGEHVGGKNLLKFRVNQEARLFPKAGGIHVINRISK